MSFRALHTDRNEMRFGDWKLKPFVISVTEDGEDGSVGEVGGRFDGERWDDSTM